MDRALRISPTEKALAIAEAELADNRKSRSYSGLVFSLREVGRLRSSLLHVESALAAFQEARSISSEAHDDFGVAAADDFTAMLLCHLGRPAEAAALHLEAAETFADLDDVEDEALARAWGSWALLEAGEPEDALRQARIAARLVPSTTNLAGQAPPLADLGRIPEARACFERIVEPDGPSAWLTRMRAHVDARDGNRARAVELFSEALSMLEDEGDLAEIRCCQRQLHRLGIHGAVRNVRPDNIGPTVLQEGR